MQEAVSGSHRPRDSLPSTIPHGGGAETKGCPPPQGIQVIFPSKDTTAPQRSQKPVTGLSCSVCLTLKEKYFCPSSLQCCRVSAVIDTSTACATASAGAAVSSGRVRGGSYATVSYASATPTGKQKKDLYLPTY